MAETGTLKVLQCGFVSHRRHMIEIRIELSSSDQDLFDIAAWASVALKEEQLKNTVIHLIEVREQDA